MTSLRCEILSTGDEVLTGMIADPNPRDTALGLLALMVGSLTLARALAGTSMSDDFLRAGKKLAERVLAR